MPDSSEMRGIFESLQTGPISDPSLRDLAVRLAITGHTLDEAISGLQAFQDAALAAIDLENGRRLEEVRAKEDVTAVTIEVAEQARETVAALLAEKSEKEAETFRQLAERARLEAQVRIKRRKGQANAIAAEATRRLERARNEPTERLQEELAVRRKIFEIEQACWSLNQPEYERRQRVLSDEKQSVESELTSGKRRTEKLKELGITRTVAGFLVWAGYLGFAATGAAISHILYNRMPPQSQGLWEALSRFFGSIQSLGRSYGTFGSISAPLIFIICILLLFGGIVWVCDLSLKKFDGRWTGKRSPKKRGAGESDFSAKLSPLAQFFQLPLIERASFIQLLASIPYLFAAGVLMFLVTSSGPSSTLSDADGLAPHYLGAVYALLSTAASLLYVIYIVLPRMARIPEAGSGKSVSLVRANWELALLLVLLVVALGVAALAPDSTSAGDLNARITWAGLAIAMTLSSMGLAYGLIFWGQFKDVEKGERVRRQIGVAIESFGSQPTIEIGNLTDIESVQEHLDSVYKEEEAFELVRSLHATVVSFSDDPNDLGSLLDLWLQAVEGGRKSWKVTKREKIIEELKRAGGGILDYELAPEESARINEINMSATSLGARVRQIDNELTRLSEQVSGLPHHQKELSHLRAEERQLVSSAGIQKSRLISEHKRQELVFRAAFRLGARFSPPLPGRGGSGSDVLDLGAPN